MHILYFHQHFSTPKGATGTRSYEMARSLIENGHKVTMICGSYGHGATELHAEFCRGKRYGNIDGIDVIEFDLAYSNKHGFVRRSWSFMKFALHSSKIAVFTDADVIFATTTPLTAALPGIFGKWLSRRPFVFEVRDLWPELPKAMGAITNRPLLWMLGALEYIAYVSADRLIALSPGILEGIARHGIPRDRISMIPNGCDTDYFTADVKKWRPANIAASDFLAVFSGTHGLANGLDAVLEAARVLKRRNCKSIKILFIGDGMEKAKLLAKADEYDITDIVIFHDPVPKTQLIGLLAASDLGLQILANVSAFYYGTSPNKFFDYLAAGLPVMTNYPGWVADIIEEEECGLAVAPDDPEKFADALMYLADLPKSQKEKMAASAKAIGKRTFDRKILATQFVDIVTA